MSGGFSTEQLIAVRSCCPCFARSDCFWSTTDSVEPLDGTNKQLAVQGHTKCVEAQYIFLISLFHVHAILRFDVTIILKIFIFLIIKKI